MRQQNEIMKDLNYIKANHLEVCAFGCGEVGVGLGYEILRFLDLNLTVYCDNDTSKWGKDIRGGIKCISPEMLAHKKNIACVVMVSFVNREAVIDQLKQYHIPVIITHYELIGLDIIVNRFLAKCSEENYGSDNEVCKKKQSYKIKPVSNVNNKKYAVYTCITGGYDQVVEPQYYTKDCDYYLISDSRSDNLKIFKWIDVNEFVPNFVQDNARKNRFCKILGPLIFSEYRYSVYVDGNIQIKGDVTKYIENIGKSGIAAYRLPSWDDLYAHVINCMKYDSKYIVFKQIDKYCKEGMPRHYGMFECTILVRDNQNPICRKIMEDWWREVFHYSYRDQFSFTYCLWKNGIETSDVGTLGDNYRKSGVFNRMNGHHGTNRKG